MKKTLFIFLFVYSFISAQVGYVQIDHKVYPFLERMYTIGIIKNYNSFELPKTYKEVSEYLVEINNQKIELNTVDRKILESLLFEFDYTINGSLKNYTSLLTGNSFNYINKEKYLYSYADSNKTSFFVNLVGNVAYLAKEIEDYDPINTTIFSFGGTIKASFYDKYGFYIKGTNGNYKGNRDLALSYDGLKYNYKVNMNQSYESANTYFDETEGYIFADFNNAKIKIGRDRMLLGYGVQKAILSENPPPLDYIMFNLKYSIFNFTYIHSKLLDIPTSYGDSISGEMHHLDEKYFVYHRFGIDLSKHLKFGLGEIIIYGNRSFDLSYFNPFNFYKSIEHINQDRDNSMLFFDITNNSINGIRPFLTFLIDDIDFGKIGSGWYGNQTMLDAGIIFTPFYNKLSLNTIIEYTRIEPYFYTHRIPYNNFSSLGYGLSSINEPNTENFTLKIDYSFSDIISFNFMYVYNKHGENVYDENGNLIKNVGGNLKYGYRVGDSEHVNFMDGKVETKNIITFGVVYEFVRNYFATFSGSYIKNSGLINNREVNTFFNIKLKI